VDKVDPDAVGCVRLMKEELAMSEVLMAILPEGMVCGVMADVTTLALSGLGREKTSSSMMTES
jgi:hypothetical protein